MDLNDQMAEDSVRTPGEQELSKLGQLINRQLQLETEIEAKSLELSDLSLSLKRVCEEEIPAMFNSLGIQEFKLQDGSKVTVKPYYAASISEENQVDAFKWLRDNGLDDVIKHNIAVAFGRGEDEQANELKKVLAEHNVNYVEKSGVHPQTLKALVKEQIEIMSERLEEGKQFPMKLFNVFIGNKTKITKPKARR